MKALVLCLVLLGATVVPAQSRTPSGGASATLKAGAFTPARIAPDFILSGSDGKPLKLSSYRGKVVLLGFGFTSCAAVCPTTLATLRQVRTRLGSQAGDVQVIYITVDPAHDSPEVMRKYLALFDPGFVGGSGSSSQLAAVRQQYGVMARQVAGPDGKFTHSSFVYLIDPQGRLQALMPFGRQADDYVHDVRLLLGSS